MKKENGSNEPIISIKILCLSDMHTRLNNLKELEEYAMKTNYQPDYIFFCGDFVSISKINNDNEEEIKKGEIQIKQALSVLENICKKIIYVPGNHDPGTLFNSENSKKLSENSINIHKNFTKIADDLIVFGVGGSTSSLIKEDYGYFKYDFKDYDIKKFSYPYSVDFNNPDYEKSDLFFISDVKETYNKTYKSYDNDNMQYILLSHQGPLSSNTNNNFNGVGDYSGSHELDKFIFQNYKKILCNIHGHSHRSWGMCLINEVPIINLGAIKYRDFGTIIIEKSSKTNNKWKVISVEKLSLE